MTLKLITAPTVEPLSLTDAKLHLRVDHSTDDDLITSLIVAARRAAEHETHRALVSQTWEVVLDAFPAAEIQLPMPTVQSITSVKYIDASGVEQTMDSGDYVLDADTSPGWLFPAVGTDWPNTYAESTNTVRVRFLAGYGATAASVPANIVTWMRLHIGANYRNREAFIANGTPAPLPDRFFPALLDPDRAYF